MDTNGSAILFGTTSWADRGLVQSGAFYPRKTMKARERLAYYARRFPLAEIATTYRFPPTLELAAQWAERTPAGFTFDVTFTATSGDLTSTGANPSTGGLTIDLLLNRMMPNNYAPFRKRIRVPLVGVPA